MRFTELVVEKYGSLLHQVLRVPEGPGLTVIYGANEAGKSTCLSAIGDFLFGIPHRSPYGAEYGNTAMRLSASLKTADGRSLRLQRRKGRSGTLLDATGAPQDEAVLTQLLGSTTRARYASLFGLDHASLRQGGAHLLAAEGEIGRLIVEAGGGLRALMGRLAEVEAEATRQYAPRQAADRAFYAALERFETAQRRVESLQLSSQGYALAQRQLATASASLEGHRQDRLRLTAELNALTRLVRVVPALHRLDRLATALAAHADVAGLPAGFAAAVTTALERQKAAQTRLQEARSSRQAATERLAALAEPATALLEAEVAIRDLQQQAASVQRDADDRAELAAQVDQNARQLHRLHGQLQLPNGADLLAQQPERTALARVRDLSDQLRIQLPAQAQAQRDQDGLAQQQQALELRIAAAQNLGLDAPLPVQAGTFAEVPGRASSAASLGQQAEHRMQSLTELVRAQGFASPAQLMALSVPTPAAIQAEMQARAMLEQNRLHHRQVQASQMGAHREAERSIGALQAEPGVPSSAALARARAARTAAFAPIRAAHLAGRIEADAAERTATVGQYEACLQVADGLADGLKGAAEREAKLALAQAEAGRSTLAAATAAEQGVAAEAALAARTQAFAAAFPEAVQRQPSLDGLLALVERRASLLQALTEADTAQAQATQATAQLAPSLDGLAHAEAALGLSPAADASLAARVQCLAAAATQRALQRDALARDRAELAALGPRLAQATAQLAHCRQAAAGSQAAWPAALQGLALPADCSPEAAAAHVDRWADARALLEGSRRDQQRLAQLVQAAQGAGARATALGQALQLRLPTEPGPAADMLAERLKTAQELVAQRQILRRNLTDAETLERTCAEKAAAAASDLRALAQRAQIGTEDQDALQATAARSEICARLQAELAQAEGAAADLGDGQAPALSRQQWGGRDLDQLRAQREDLQQRDGLLQRAIEAAVLAEKAAQDQLASCAHENGVNQAVAERESACSHMHAALERYVELKVAHELVTTAMQAIRGAQQAPLVRRAGDLFAQATGQRYAGIDTDVDDANQPVVLGRRPDGSAVAVAAMSDGTRDQLFLAFRLASLEHYGASAEPLPMVADDILVHFDDPRSVATLDLLAKFGASCQVLLFTHHASVLQAAQTLQQRGRAGVIDLR